MSCDVPNSYIHILTWVKYQLMMNCCLNVNVIYVSQLRHSVHAQIQNNFLFWGGVSRAYLRLF